MVLVRVLAAALLLTARTHALTMTPLEAAWSRGASAATMRSLVDEAKGNAPRAAAAEAASISTSGWAGLWIARIEHFEKMAFTGLQVLPHYEFIGDGGEMISHVHVALGPLKGWASAAGRMKPAANGVILAFDDFWVGADAPRPRPSPSLVAAELSAFDLLTREAGRALFFENLASFPVDYADLSSEVGLVAFRFPAFDSLIVARRAPEGEFARRP